MGSETFDELALEHKDAYILAKLWATLYSAGTVLVDRFRARKAKVTAVVVTHDEASAGGRRWISPEDAERRINDGVIKVVKMLDDNGNRICNAAGQVGPAIEAGTFAWPRLALLL